MIDDRLAAGPSIGCSRPPPRPPRPWLAGDDGKDGPRVEEVRRVGREQGVWRRGQMKSVPLCAVIGLLLLAADRDVNGISACFDVSDNFASGRIHEHHETTCGVVYAHLLLSPAFRAPITP